MRVDTKKNDFRISLQNSLRFYYKISWEKREISMMNLDENANIAQK